VIVTGEPATGCSDEAFTTYCDATPEVSVTMPEFATDTPFTVAEMITLPLVVPAMYVVL
jgi:hypothetical protein